MSDVNANIRVNIDTQAATSQLQALQQQITLMQKSMAANAKNNMSLGIDGTQATQQIMQVRDAAGQLDKALASSSRSFGASFKTMTNAFRKQGAEMELIKRRAAAISAEYKKVGDAGRGMSSVLKTAGSAENLASAETAMRLQMMTRSMEQMGNAAVNWGKNMQWAGRQMMVGFTVPLTIGAALAVKAFQDIEREIINLQRVYGDFNTSAAETDRMTESIRGLSVEMAKLGFTAKETIGLAADAAAIGFQGDDLISITTQATNMASLGMISQEQALDTMVSMTNAFGVQADELKGVVDYLNAVENQTVLSLEDMSQAIPLVAPVVRGLGGDIKDLSVVMTAMREGGIGANEAANALKTGLARLVTPTKQALKTTSEMGMNLKNIVAENEGDFLGMINEFAAGLQNLSDLQQQQVLSDVFGKRQFARFGAMFNSLSEGGSQAAKAMELMVAPAEDLARLSEKELGAIEASSTMKMTAAIEELKMAIAPLGEMVMKFITPLIELGTKVANIFTGMPEGVQKFIATLVAGVGIVIPAVLMLVGLLANMGGNLIKAAKAGLELLFGFKGAAKGASELTLEELEQAAAAQQLATAQMSVTTSLERQTVAVNNLIAAYNRLNATSGAGGRSIPPMKFATGGRVPGSGNSDKIPALLTPGEYVINKKQSQKHSGFLSALNNGSVRGFNTGYTGEQPTVSTPQSGIIRVQGSEASIDINVDPNLSDAELQQITNLISAAIARGVIDGTQEGLDAVKPDLQAAADSVTPGKTKTRKGQEVPNAGADFRDALPRDIKQTMRKAEKPYAIAAAHASDPVSVSGREYADRYERDRASGVSPASPAHERLGDFVTGRDLPNEGEEGFDKLKQSADEAGLSVDQLKQKIIETRQELVEVDQLAPNVDAQPDWLNDASKQKGNSRTGTPAGADARMAAKSMLAMHNDPDQPDILGGTRANFEAYADENALSPEKRAAGQAKIDAAEQRIVQRLEEIESGLDETARWVENGADKAQATDVAWNDVKAEVEGFGDDADMADFDQWRSSPGQAGRVTVKDGLTDAKAEAMYVTRSGSGGRSALDARGREAFRTSQTRRLFPQGRDYEGVDVNYKPAQDGMEDGEEYTNALNEAAANNDPYDAATRDTRNSPHPDAAKDGADDAKAYMGGRDGVLSGNDADGVQANAINQEVIQAERELEDARKRAAMAAQGLSNEEIENAMAKDQSASNTQEQTTEELENAAAKDKNAAATERSTTSEKKEERSQKMEFMRGKVGMAGMIGGQVMSMAGMAAMQAEGDKFLGVSKEMSAGFLTAAGQVNSFAGMFGPWGQAIALAVTALTAAVGYGVIKWREGVDEMSREAAQAGMALSGVAGAAKKAADIFGKATLAEKRRFAEISDEEKLKYQEYAAILGDGGGAELITDMEGLLPQDRVDYAADIIKEAIINGMIEATDAPTFARAIGEQMGEEKMGEDIARKLNDYNDEYTTNTAKAMEESSKALDKFTKSTEYANLQYAKQQGLQVNYADASFVMGAATQNMIDFRNAVLAAEDDWINGRTNFEDYQAALDASREAQTLYTDALKYARDNVSDKGGFEQAKLAVYKAQTGKTDEDVKTQNEAVAAMTGVETKYINSFGAFFEKYGTNMKTGNQARRDDGAGMTYTDAGVTELYREKMKSQGLQGQELIDAMEEFTSSTNTKAFAEFSREMNDELNKVEERAREFEMSGMDFEEAAQWANQLSKPWEDASELFVYATDELAMSVTEAADYVASEVAKMNDPEHWKNKEEEANREDVSNLERDIIADLDNAGGFQDFTNSLTDLGDAEKIFKLFDKDVEVEYEGPAGSREGKDFNTERNVKLSSALSNFNDLGIDPKDLASLSDEIAATIEAGYETGGYEGAERLSELVDGESLLSFFEMAASDDGIITPDEIQDYIEKIEELKKISPDNLQIFGIDTNDAEQVNKLTEDMITNLQSFDRTSMDSINLDEGTKNVFGRLAYNLMTDEDEDLRMNAGEASDYIDKNIVTPIREKLADTEIDAEVKVDTAIEVIETGFQVNFTTEDVERIKANLAEVYGDLTLSQDIADMDPITILQEIKVAFGVEGMGAEELEAAASALLGPYSDAAGRERAAELQRIAGIMRDLGDTTGGENNDFGRPPTSSGGGGGGGGKEEEFDEGYKKFDPKKRWDNYRDREKSKQAGIIGYTEAIRRSTNLTDDQIEKLKENEKAYENWKDAYKEWVRTGNNDELEKWERNYMKGGKGSGVKVGEDIATQNAAETRKIKTNKKKEYEQRNKVEGDKSLDYFAKQQLYNDPALMAQYMSDNDKLAKEAANEAKDRAMAETTILDIYERQLEVQGQILDYQQQQFDVAIMQAEYAAENDFFDKLGGTVTIGDGVEVDVDRASLEQRNAEIDASLKLLEIEHIRPIEDKIEAQREVIKGLERETIANEDLVKDYEKQVEAQQRKVEDMQRALELRQREGEMLEHDLTLMGYMEEEITEAYDKRITALDKVLEINQQIAQAQQDQLGLADALSKGDIGAAARAAQQMQQNQMQFASDQYRSQMEINKENAINNLTGPESGMTREQIELRQRELAEDEYQTNLKIRDIEDQIYDINMKIRAENDIIQITKDKIEEANRKIRDYEWDKYQAEKLYLKGLEDEQLENEDILAQADAKVVKAAGLEKVERTRFERGRTLLEAEQQLQLAGLTILNEQGALHKYNLKMIKAQAHEAKRLWDILTSGKSELKDFELPDMPNVQEFMNNYEKGLADIKTPDFKDIIPNMSTASYNVPVSAVPSAAVNGIMGAITNNNYNNNVNINTQQVDVPALANMVMREMNMQEGRNTR